MSPDHTKARNYAECRFLARIDTRALARWISSAKLYDMKTTARYEVVEGTRVAPGQVLKTFPADGEYRCGGAATACLRWFASATKRTGKAMFFRKVS